MIEPPATSGDPMLSNGLDWLRGMSEAYLAITSGETLDDRVAEVCVQTRRFLGAADSRLVFSRENVRPPDALAGHEISVRLLDRSGWLTVTAPAGQRWSDADQMALQQLVSLISAPLSDARRLEAAVRSGQIGALLGGVAGPAEVLGRFERQGADLLGANTVLVRLFDDANGQELLDASVAAAVDAVIRTGELMYLTGEIVGGGGDWAVLPLGMGEAQFGALAVAYGEAQAFDEVQRGFLVDVAQRLSAAIDRSRAYDRECTAREAAERASGRLRELQGLASDLASAETQRGVAEVLLRRAMASFDAVTGVVAAVSTGSPADVLAAAHPFGESHWGDVGRGIAQVLADADQRRQRPFTVVDSSGLPGRLGQQLGALGVHQLAWQSIVSPDGEIGVLFLGWSGTAGDRVIDRGLMQAQLALVGSTWRRAERYDTEHAIADTLQRAMLALPPITAARVRWSVLYRAGSTALAGGDWYDLIEIDDHRLAIVVGDIVGRGVDAAASMGQLRSAARALATRIDEPGEVVSALDAYADTTGRGRYSSLAYLVLDTVSGEIAHCIAGHPPPVLRQPDGRISLMESGRGPLLGIRGHRDDAVHRIVPGTRIVLYTDGLVDRRGESIDSGVARLTHAVAAQPPNIAPEDSCRDLVDRMLAPAADADDVAIVVVDYI